MSKETDQDDVIMWIPDEDDKVTMELERGIQKLYHKSKIRHSPVSIRSQSCHFGLLEESIQKAGIIVALCILACCPLINNVSATGTGSLSPVSDNIIAIGEMDPIVNDDRPSVRGSITSSGVVTEVQSYLKQSGFGSEPAPGWKFRGNLNNTGEYDDGGIRPGNVKLWEYSTNSIISSSPAINNRIIYFGSWDHNIYALSAESGEKIWEYSTGGNVRSRRLSENSCFKFQFQKKNQLQNV